MQRTAARRRRRRKMTKREEERRGRVTMPPTATQRASPTRRTIWTA
jgi:hypothetical protein